MKCQLKISNIEIRVPCPNEGVHRTGTIRTLLSTHIDVVGKKVVDLGAGPCIFSRIARHAGAHVTAVDGRVDRLPDKEILGSIEFIQSDVRDFDTRDFDVKFVFGLLYHLEFEDQAKLLENCAQSGITIIDTQVHRENLIASYPQDPWQYVLHKRGDLNGIEFLEGTNTMASIGNRTSFWPTEESLIEMIRAAGFRQLTIVDPAYVSKYGVRRFMICSQF